VRVRLMVPLDAQHQRWLETDNLYHLGQRALGTPHTEWPPVLQNLVDDAMEFADQKGALYVVKRGGDAVGKVSFDFFVYHSVFLMLILVVSDSVHGIEPQGGGPQSQD
jgi:hypothetical protein